MKKFLEQKWVVPVAALVLVLALGTVAFAATGASGADQNQTAADDASAAGTTPDHIGRGGDTPWGHQRSDETLLTGDILTQVQEAALAEVGSDATVIRAETDADGNAAYEVHVQKADGTRATVYVDESFNVVSVEDHAAGGPGHHRGSSDSQAGTTGNSTTTLRSTASDTI